MAHEINAILAMPRGVRVDRVHCEKIPLIPNPRANEEPILTCVARSVNKFEREKSPAAVAAWRKEWDRLHAIGTWGESRACEKSVAEVGASSAGETHDAHGHRNRNLKGRVVFVGNQAKDLVARAAM